MSNTEIAAAALECVGGTANVLANSLCATRLRITVHNPDLINVNALSSISGVLGVAIRGLNDIEIIFGPNLVRGVHRAFSRLTGIVSHSDKPSQREDNTKTNFKVQITPEIPGKPKKLAAEETPQPEKEEEESDEQYTTALLDLLDTNAQADTSQEEEAPSLPRASKGNLLVINGPNINMLGIREPNLYGVKSFEDLLELCKTSAREAGFEHCECYQSNHEGSLVDRIQEAYDTSDAIVINPGAYTHTSIALLDALKAVDIPTIEVHISNVEAREDFRQISYVREACEMTISGEGIEGYRRAIFELAKIVE